MVVGVRAILLVHHCCHADQRLLNLGFAYHAMVQPIGNMLAGDAQRRTVFHESNVVYVGYLGAPHAVFYPAHHISQNALSIVVNFLANRFG